VITSDELGYFEKVARFVQREPVREQDKQFLGMLAPLGIQKGKPFNPDPRTKEILTRAAKVGHAMVATISYDSRYLRKLRWPGTSRWEELILTEHPDYVNRNYAELDGRAALYYQAAGASKSILLDVVGAGSKYAGAFKDSKGDWLMGDNNYRLHVPANVPAKDFWSVTVYDAETRSMIDTDQNLSGRDSYQKLKTNADGSVDLYFGPAPLPVTRATGSRPSPAKASSSTSAGTAPCRPTSTNRGSCLMFRKSGDRGRRGKRR
jgi:hypothetical protein